MRVLKEIFRVLKPWGRLLIDVADGEYLQEHFQSRSWEWMDKKHFVCRERCLSLDKQRLISREVITHVEKGILTDQFYAERLYGRENLSELLKTAGFSNIATHGALSSDSKRNQDLGMIESRIIVSALVRKEWMQVKVKEKKSSKNVVVVLGDPTKADPLKPFGIFDDDDLYAVDQLKGALRELERTGNHSFTYLTNHDTLYSGPR